MVNVKLILNEYQETMQWQCNAILQCNIAMQYCNAIIRGNAMH